MRIHGPPALISCSGVLRGSLERCSRRLTTFSEVVQRFRLVSPSPTFDRCDEILRGRYTRMFLISCSPMEIGWNI